MLTFSDHKYAMLSVEAPLGKFLQPVLDLRSGGVSLAVIQEVTDEQQDRSAANTR